MNIYNYVCDFPNQIENSYLLDVPKTKKKFRNFRVIGMGGSYIAGLLIKEYLRDELDIEAYPGELPEIDKKTLVILISYSGNTKETVQAFNKYKKNDVLVITSGGKLRELAVKNKKLLIEMPEKLHQRFTFSYGFFPVIKFLEKNNYLKTRKKTINKTVKILKKYKWKIEKEARELAGKIKNKQLLCYATNYFYPSAYRFQTSLEEDIKAICHANRITELFHNELETFPDNKSYVILIIDNQEIKKFRKQMNYFKRLINYHEIKYKRFPKEIRIFVMFYFVDFLGFYLSRIKHTKMGETPLSDRIKKL